MEKTQHDSFWRTIGTVPVLVEHWEEIDSTNTRARELCQSVGNPVLVTAAHQTAGRGRQGRSWQDVPNAAVLMSVGLPAQWSQSLGHLTLTAAASLGVLEELARYVPEGALRLKYPNDLWAKPAGLPPGKLAGILLEAEYTGSQQDVVVIGIGINVAAAPNLPDMPYPARALSEVASRPYPDVRSLAESTAEHILWLLLHENAEHLIDRWKSALGLEGRCVRLRSTGEELRVVGFTAEGNLTAERISDGARVVLTDVESFDYDPFAE